MAKKAPKSDKNADRDLVARVRKRYTTMEAADHHNRVAAMEDLRFVFEPGQQWTPQMKTDRGDRPCFEFNELRIKIKRVVNDMRANRPQAKVRGYDDGDKGTADIIEGVGRDIWNTSDGDTITDHAAEYQVGGGMACWRVKTGYQTDESFDQDVFLDAIRNPFCLYWDPAAQDPLKRDADDWILTEKISRKAYDEKYPDAEPVDFDGTEFDNEGDDWGTEDDAEQVRIAEYWYKEPKKRELWLLNDGRVVEADDPAAKKLPTTDIQRRRVVNSHKIMTCIVSGEAVLEPPSEWAGLQHPFVVVFGEEVILDGKTYWFGLPRFGKDAQRNLNLTQTAALEQAARSLQSPYFATVEKLKGLENKTAEAFKKGFPVVFYNHDKNEPGPPSRVVGPDIPAAMLALGTQASQLLDSVSGVYAANLGERSNEKSGRAIIARQQQGEIATFNYQDNMAKGVQRTWEIMLDLIPRVIDTQRQLRILGPDDSVTYKQVNQVVQDPAAPGGMATVNDITRGKYDVTITVGPNFATKRQEAAEAYSQLYPPDSPSYPLIADLVAKAQDLPYSNEIAERLKLGLPPQVQQMIDKDSQVPPEVAQGMARVQGMAQQVQQHAQLVQQAAGEAQQEKAAAEKAKSDAAIAAANVKVLDAQFKADVANFKAEQAQQQAAAATDATTAAGQQSDSMLQQYGGIIQRLGDTVAALEQRMAMLGAHTAAAVSEVHHAIPPPPPPRAKIRSSRAKRINGELVVTHDYEQPAPDQITASHAKRENGELVVTHQYNS